TVFSSTPGEDAFISKDEGVVNGYHLNLTDNHATGAAIFTAYDSNIGSNVVGWNGVTGVDDTALADRILVYPNPATGFVKIKSDAGSKIEITDSRGRLLEIVYQKYPEQMLPLEKYETGLYLMMITAVDKSKITKKLVVK